MSVAPDSGVVAFLEGRLTLFYLLQRAYAAPLDAETALLLREEAIVYGALLDRDLGGPLPEVTDADEPEFNRLFVGPGKLVAPLYGSVYFSPDELVMQDTTRAVRLFYREHGLEVATAYGEPDDALPVELEFYARVQQTALAAYEAGDNVESRRLLEVQRAFWTGHLSRWVGDLARRVEAGTTSPLYRSLAIILREVAGAETQVMTEIASVLTAKEENAHD